MPTGSPPPRPGPVVLPNVTVIENALREITFPISKAEMIDQIPEDETIVMQGRNVDLRQIVRDLNDDYFESEDEFREALESTYGARADDAEVVIRPRLALGFPDERPTDSPGASDQPGLLPEDE